MPIFSSLSQFIETITSKLTKPRRSRTADGVKAADVLAAMVDLATYVDENSSPDNVKQSEFNTTISSINTTLAAKADASALAAKANTSDVNTALAAKADASALAAKANTSDVNTALAAKADASALAAKANTSDVNTALAAKADVSALAGKANTSDVNTALVAKLEKNNPRPTGVAHFGSRVHMGTGADFTDKLEHWIEGAATHNGRTSILALKGLGTPTIVKSTGVGTSGTATISGNNIAGTITLVVSSGVASGTLANISFPATLESAPYVLISPGNAAAAAQVLAQRPYVSNVTTSGFSIIAGGTAFSNNTYIFNYLIIM